MSTKQLIRLFGGSLLLCFFSISVLAVRAQHSADAGLARFSDANTGANTSVLIAHSPSIKSVPQMAPQIEMAPISGVSGYPIGIFGADFGSTSGSVQILGQTATILEWTDTFISAEIPAVADGNGSLTVTAVEGQSGSQAFEVYTIDPDFQRAPINRFTSILRGKTAVVQNIDPGNTFCYQQPSGAVQEPSKFVTDFDCGFSEIVGDGHVTMNIPDGGGAIVAVDVEQTLSGTYYFQFYGFSSWYGDSFPYWYTDNELKPQAYTIEVSVDSTDGIDGNWLTVYTEWYNTRGIRLHKIEVPDGGYRWIRMNSSIGRNGPQVRLKEIRLYESSNAAASDLDMIAIYGDSITDGAFYHIGQTGLSLQISDKIGSADEPIFTPFGLSGQDATGLLEQADIDYDIFDAFATDNVGEMARYWGIALGSNDTGFSNLGEPGSLIEEFDERVESIVQLMISQNKVPILARIPDANEQTSPTELAKKKKILDDIDRIAADYRLIPGPDLYTPMRLNIERDNGSWYWPGDPYHQNWAGRLVIVEAWADALVRGTNRTAVGSVATSTPTPVPANTPDSTPTNTPESTLTNTPEPILSSTPTSTAVNTVEPLATNTLVPTATHTPTAINTPLPRTTTDGALPTTTTIPATTTLVPTATTTPRAASTSTAVPTRTTIPSSTVISTGTAIPTFTVTPEPFQTPSAGTPSAQATDDNLVNEGMDKSNYLPIVGR